jgi:hypothetical protein
MTSWVVLALLAVCQPVAPVAPQAVVETLERENARIAVNYRNGTGSSEDYAEWYASVLGKGLEMLPHLTAKARPRMIAALVNGSYNDDSPFAKDLAFLGEEAVPAVLALVHSDMVAHRWNAYALMVEMLRGHKAGSLRRPLAAASVPRLQRALRAGLQDPEVTCRRHVVEGLVAVGDRDAIPLLTKLAASDPDNEPGNRSVRGLAINAITILRQPR